MYCTKSYATLEAINILRQIAHIDGRVELGSQGTLVLVGDFLHTYEISGTICWVGDESRSCWVEIIRTLNHLLLLLFRQSTTILWMNALVGFCVEQKLVGTSPKNGHPTAAGDVQCGRSRQRNFKGFVIGTRKTAGCLRQA